MDVTSFAHNYYDYDRGWTDTNPGWHEVVVKRKDIINHLEIVKWLYDRLDNPERHARWILDASNYSRFKFRYERDCILFRLTWE